MPATRILFIALIFLYFVIPVPLSKFIFDDTFYIYSAFHPEANTLSLIYGLIFGYFVLVLLKPNPSLVRNRTSIDLANWRGAKIAYYAMIVYSLALMLYGTNLRSLGASRLDLLSAMDDFLLPGMGILLLLASVYAVSNATKRQFYALLVMFFAIDLVFNGKIFSFVALVLFFARLDYMQASRRAILKAVTLAFGFGVIILFLSGLTRIYLAGGFLTTNVEGITYLFGSEFLGVQATIGWGIDYFNRGYPLALSNFVIVLEEFYIRSVGHGLGASPGAYFQANFGGNGPLIAIFGCLISLMAVRASARWLGFVAYLIVAINFQHFLRHGIDVFVMKVLTQMIFAMFISILINSFDHKSMHHQARPLANI